ncbi:MAG: ABC transporter ATP-binding protein [Candidatus Rokubacteria bacterium]|jgi:branched-chain amino acid transport system ATP-binding protein|nr:ABC transporter ATP-binding protein [Candidatus Rokubacteria bacterium]
MPILEIQDVTMAFGGLIALKSVTMDVAAGEIRGLIGPNGAGKSTLFNVLSGLNQPQRGRVLFQGDDLLALRPHQVASRGIARTFQAAHLFRGMTVLENVMAGLHDRARGGVLSSALSLPAMRRAEDEARVRAFEALRFIEMDHVRDRLATELSYGQQRLVEIARALVREPTLLLLDEPAAGLSVARITGVDELLRRIRNEKGITIVLVEHVIRLVMGISDQVTVLNYGEKIAEGPPERIREDRAVIEAYLGKEDAGARH